MIVDARGVPPSAWPALLERMVQQSVRDRRAGTPPLAATRVVYKREPSRRELWQSAASTAAIGDGDCEDLAIWLAADLRCDLGADASVDVKPVRPGLRHARVRVRTPNGRVVILDPSRWRGMRGKG